MVTVSDETYKNFYYDSLWLSVNSNTIHTYFSIIIKRIYYQA